MRRSLLLLGMTLAASVISLSASTPLSAFEGRPLFREGFDRGYFVWREGDEWHVRWTTQGNLLLFTGQVIADGGDIRDLDRVDLERESRLVRTGSRPVLVRGPRGRVRTARRPTTAVGTREQDRVEKDGDRTIRFRARTDADIDGFHFKLDRRVTQIRFVLEINGVSRAVAVEVGRNNVKPDDNPFSVSLH
ncbi:MAG: hypothetical protein ACRD2A_17785 [Vicinamibacterales bacterium]